MDLGLYSSSAEQKYQILLQVAQAANAQLELSGVLEAVHSVLLPIVPVDVIAVAAVEGALVRPYDVYVPGMDRHKGESAFDAVSCRLGTRGYRPEPYPLAGSATEHAGHTGRAYVVQDLEKMRPYSDDKHMYEHGGRSCVLVPLRVSGRLIGAMTFQRRTVHSFSPEEISLLEDVSSPIALAVSNSFAYEEVRRLKDQARAENLALREEIDRESMFEEIVGRSSALKAVLARVDRVAATDSTVLITGETGTGKELIARAIHRRSSRSGRALIKVNCTAFPETLIASELFGHEKGAFTGALRRRIGRFELASGGTVFLDEIGELSPGMQVALLRVLQEGEFERLGTNQTIRSDVRVIAATNRNLTEAVARGEFRSDLFYRLNVFPVEVPPLRERKEDIPLLVQYFAERYGAKLGRKLDRIDAQTMQRLLAYSWPGNVRELQNVVERAAILSEGEVLKVQERELYAPEHKSAADFCGCSRQVKQRMIESVLADSAGRVSGPRGAAAKIGIPSTTLESMIKRFGINKHRFR